MLTTLILTITNKFVSAKSEATKHLIYEYHSECNYLSNAYIYLFLPIMQVNLLNNFRSTVYYAVSQVLLLSSSITLNKLSLKTVT